MRGISAGVASRMADRSIMGCLPYLDNGDELKLLAPHGLGMLDFSVDLVKPRSLGARMRNRPRCATPIEARRIGCGLSLAALKFTSKCADEPAGQSDARGCAAGRGSIPFVPNQSR